MRLSSLFQSLFTLSCFGLLAVGVVSLSGCAANQDAAQEKKEPVLQMQVFQVDQLSRLGDKISDGQYVVAKVGLKNLSNKTITFTPENFKLENITENEKERYSQPAETGLSNDFAKDYGEVLKSKLMDFAPTNLYPRMELDRYFVFMVPSDAKITGYQITYTPEKISTPLAVTGTTNINDHRNESTALPPTE